MLKFYRFIREGWGYIGPFIGLWGLAGIFNYSLSDIWHKLIAVAPLIFSVNIVYLVIVIFAVYSTSLHILHRKVPITILSTHVDVFLESPRGDKARLCRTQTLRANREDVTGYQYSVWVTPPGKIPKNSIECSIDHCTPGDQEKYFDGNESRWQVLHSFPPLPWHFGFKKIKRTDTFEMIDAYTKDEESFSFGRLDAYRHEQIIISIYFHPSRVCLVANCRAMRVNANGVVKLPLTQVSDGGRLGVQLNTPKARPGDTFKITWKYPPLPA